MEPSYFVKASKGRTTVRLPIHDVPELDKPVKASALATAGHLRRHGWRNVGVIDATTKRAVRSGD